MKVLLVDDHRILHGALRTLLQTLFPHLEVHCFDSVPGAVEFAAGHDDVALALLDLGLEGENGVSAVTRMRIAQPSVPIVVVSGLDDPVTMQAALHEGARAYVVKTADATELIDAVRRLLHSDTSRDPMVPRTPSAPLSKSHGDARLGATPLPLTPRQQKVAVLLAQGKSNKEIARDLGIAEQTVKGHVGVIFRLLGVSNRGRAIRELNARTS